MTQRKLIKAQSATLSAEHEDAVLAKMRAVEAFKPSDVRRWMKQAGVPEVVHADDTRPRRPIYHLASKLVQRERVAGRVAYVNKWWVHT